ncbi:MAG: Tryptophan RNA-binding attenuator protein inhibitory protein [Sporomusa sp.]|jgi:DnaJ-class molecular chaperone|nr:Tryptophan RNA-binding attenuator protein inhibitory protein [Sporomusa sp.]
METELTMEKECSTCHGLGKIDNKNCDFCNGTGTVLTEDGKRILNFLRDGIRTSEN